MLMPKVERVVRLAHNEHVGWSPRGEFKSIYLSSLVGQVSCLLVGLIVKCDDPQNALKGFSVQLIGFLESDNTVQGDGEPLGEGLLRAVRESRGYGSLDRRDQRETSAWINGHYFHKQQLDHNLTFTVSSPFNAHREQNYSQVGPTFACIIGKQFHNFRWQNDGKRKAAKLGNDHNDKTGWKGAISYAGLFWRPLTDWVCFRDVSYI